MSLHQSLMDSAYDKWETGSYHEFLMRLDFLERSAVVLGNLNYQVENGGFSQWMFNGYNEGSLFLTFVLDDINTEISKQVKGLVVEAMHRFNDYPGVNCADVDNLDDLDSDYYAVSSKFLEEVEQYLESKKVNT